MTTQDDVCIISRDNGFAVGNLVKKIKGGAWILCFLFRKPQVFGELMVKKCWKPTNLYKKICQL